MQLVSSPKQQWRGDFTEFALLPAVEIPKVR